MTEIFIVLGVVVLSCALRSFRNRFVRKLGAVGILAATFLVFYFPTSSIAAGVGGLLIWFLLPWVELLTRIRKLRLPVNKSLEQQTPPNNLRFPTLTETTDEIEKEDFEYVSDNGWEWDGMNQFYRLFYRDDERLQAAICLTEQEGISWVSLTLTSRHEDGRIFRSSNVPFSSPMKNAPYVELRQLPFTESFGELLGKHQSWITELGFSTEDLASDSPDELIGLIEQETGRQIKHNLDAGLIRLGDTAGTFRYSWRGLFYLYFQLVKDMVKMC